MTPDELRAMSGKGLRLELCYYDVGACDPDDTDALFDELERRLLLLEELTMALERARADVDSERDSVASDMRRPRIPEPRLVRLDAREDALGDMLNTLDRLLTLARGGTP
jgi:hypothetical protein